MIGSLRGVLLERAARPDGAGELLVEAAGVGYRVVVPAGTLARAGVAGSAVFLHIHTHVREDAIVLYGFSSLDERACFEALIAAHGVGPSVALALLSVHSPATLRRAVAEGDAGALTLVPGIGPKTAARLLVELQSRLGPPAEVSGLEAVGAGAGGALGEVRAALAGLGYGPDEVRVAVGRLPDEGDAADLLRLALKELAGRR